jgi:predicted small metal-binding protein
MRRIVCDCGYIARGESDEELLQDIEAHFEVVHPEIAGKISRADLLAMAEEVEELRQPRGTSR